jgi:hypothetical protein
LEEFVSLARQWETDFLQLVKGLAPAREIAVLRNENTGNSAADSIFLA